MMNTQRIRNLAIAAGILVLATACGSDAEVVAPEPEPTEVVSAPTEATIEVTAEPTVATDATDREGNADGGADTEGAEPVEGDTDLVLGESLGEPPALVTRLCTRNIEQGEVLNLRAGPTVDDPVIARVPSRSCALTTSTVTDERWVPVRFETGQVRIDGYVSNNFVEVAAADNIDTIVVEWVQAVLDGRDRSQWEYGPDLADVSFARMEQELRGGRAVPYVGTADHCVFVGDVTVRCAVQVNDPDGWEAGQFQVSITGIGFNGYGPEYFPEDFGDEPLVTGVTDCGLFPETCQFDDWGEPSVWNSIVVDSDAGMLGVPLGSEPDAAVARLTEILGPPLEDTGWVAGCPLDGDLLNERYVQWGALTVGFLRDGGVGAPEGFWYWSYEFNTELSDPTVQSHIRLPGQLRGDAALTEISEAARLPIEVHELLGDPVINGPGWTLLGRQSGDIVELAQAGVPYIPVCD